MTDASFTCALFGINNCDSIKKARRWLDEAGVAYIFHDYRIAGVDADRLAGWCASVGWEKLLNRRSLTWRGLDSSARRQNMDEARAIALMAKYPALIKRPVLELAGHIEVGFSAARYATLLLA